MNGLILKVNVSQHIKVLLTQFLHKNNKLYSLKVPFWTFPAQNGDSDVDLFGFVALLH